MVKARLVMVDHSFFLLLLCCACGNRKEQIDSGISSHDPITYDYSTEQMARRHSVDSRRKRYGKKFHQPRRVCVCAWAEPTPPIRKRKKGPQLRGWRLFPRSVVRLCLGAVLCVSSALVDCTPQELSGQQQPRSLSLSLTCLSL